MKCPNCGSEVTKFKKRLTFESDVYLIEDKVIVDHSQTPIETYNCLICSASLATTVKGVQALVEAAITKEV